jgi:hypothetical protein
VSVICLNDILVSGKPVGIASDIAAWRRPARVSTQQAKFSCAASKISEAQPLDEKAITFYEHFDFRWLSKETQKMFIAMKTIQRQLGICG